MSVQIMINLTIAIIWMFLNNAWTFSGFVSGFIIGLGIVYLLRNFFPDRFYFLGVIAIVKLVVIFLRELVLSSVEVIGQILQPSLKIQPGIFAMDIELKKDWEVTVLSCLITLTPGTLVVDVSPNNKTLYIHAMHLGNVEEAKSDIKNTFEKAIKGVSRS
ncbi:multisubunit sodium/proton antiporter, MrpE subunit [Alteribacillus persepolensis]|uniref:Multisubunit sodium/proton antiporter, MrpE subunit n=1 Tax=Alteribacillus persepolensis TaxID=568899 RepID=A0A1G8CNG7_9BACI|nr:Na+/H+ antiporter subunit E [Alteribacillus persepolensis]SDH46400.1 multisubunit sodium/proton antiporter, MrpE subunit [Alteribacillus persepolensis]